MPKYLKDTDVIIEKNVLDQMIKKATNNQQPIMLALLYLIGSRPAEMISLKRDNFEILDKNIHIKLPTKKGGLDRTIEYDFDTVYLKDIILPYLERIREGNIFSFGTTRLKQIVYKLSENKLMPYTFRHSRLMKLSVCGATPYELMIFKGARDVNSVAPYIYHTIMLTEFNKKKIESWTNELPSFIKKRAVERLKKRSSETNLFR